MCWPVALPTTQAISPSPVPPSSYVFTGSIITGALPWTVGANPSAPYAVVYDAASVNVGDNLYSWGGHSTEAGTAVGNFNRFNMRSPLTTTGLSGPAAGAFAAAAATDGADSIWLTGGYTTNYAAVQNVINLYSIAGNTSTAKTVLPAARARHGMVYHNGKLYLVAGNNGSFVTLVYIYDIAGDSWSTGAAIPTARYGAAVWKVGTKIYVAGGCTDLANPQTVSAKLEVYDILADTWTTKLDMPVALVYGKGFGTSSMFLVVGGSIGQGATTKAMRYVLGYDIANNYWFYLPPMEIPICRGNLGSYDNWIFYSQGMNEQSGALGTWRTAGAPYKPSYVMEHS